MINNFEDAKRELPEYTEKFEEIEQQIEENKQAFIDEFTEFEKDTSLEILKILDEKKHMLNVEVYGLAAIIRALIHEYGDPLMIDGVVEYLKHDFTEE